MRLRQWKITLPFLLCLVAAPAAAAGLDFDKDGSYRWEVAAGAGGRNSCCYTFSRGSVELVGCALGDGHNEFAPRGPCDVESDSMQIFVDIRDGRAQDIRAYSSNCPVKAAASVVTIEAISASDSIAWLLEEAAGNFEVMDDAVMALSFHTKSQALPALFGLLKNTDLPHEVREQAVFWLVQTNYDEAFAYIDRLLK